MNLDEPVDPDSEQDVERELNRLLRASPARLVVIDLRTPLVTAAALRMLLRLRVTVHGRNGTLHVVARRPLARRVFRLTGLTRVLRVSATMSGVAATALACSSPHPADAGSGVHHERPALASSRPLQHS
ncbi:anti-anti-sigma factor [Actinacidiphila yanglinensis]|uniref:Anti-anti-sigma factor n=2 Tax=Actinacidiphila yanglinensis TaxID=310779 RepID=A0A1H6DQ32_9ACTN|nr:anti-anti-sigma factor [Actinacidiphila yanglinensis]